MNAKKVVRDEHRPRHVTPCGPQKLSYAQAGGRKYW
jgi:hypothetical protein